MRLALLSFVVLAVATPLGWAAATPTGSLSIEDGRGTVTLKGKGIVIGRLDRGEISITDLSPLDQWSPRLNGVPRGKTVWTRSKDINFYIPGGRYRITVTGTGFSISARGQGVATVDGTPDLTGATGVYAVGDTDPTPLPADAITFQYGVPAATKPATKAGS